MAAQMLKDAAALALLCSKGTSYTLLCFPIFQGQVARELRAEIDTQAAEAALLGIDVDPHSVTIEEIAEVAPGYAGVRAGR